MSNHTQDWKNHFWHQFPFFLVKVLWLSPLPSHSLPAILSMPLSKTSEEQWQRFCYYVIRNLDNEPTAADEDVAIERNFCAHFKHLILTDINFLLIDYIFWHQTTKQNVQTKKCNESHSVQVTNLIKIIGSACDGRFFKSITRLFLKFKKVFFGLDLSYDAPPKWYTVDWGIQAILCPSFSILQHRSIPSWWAKKRSSSPPNFR